MEEIQGQHNIIINHILLIYKDDVYLSRNSERLNLIRLKNHILETKNLEENIAQNNLHKSATFLKNCRLPATCYTEINLKYKQRKGLLS